MAQALAMFRAGVLDREQRVSSVNVSGVQALNVLLENQGHLNYGPQIVGDSKGAHYWHLICYFLDKSTYLYVHISPHGPSL